MNGLQGISTIQPQGRLEAIKGGLSPRGKAALDELIKRKGPAAIELALSILPGSGEVISAQESGRAASQAYEDIGAGRIGKGFGGLAESVVAGLGAIPIVGEGMRMASTAMDLASDIARQMPGLPGLGMVAFHGTPHKFAPTKRNPLGEFDLGKMGTGEGAQTYGHGIYLAESKDVGEYYKGWTDRVRKKYTIDGEDFYPETQRVINNPGKLIGTPKSKAVELVAQHGDNEAVAQAVTNIPNGQYQTSVIREIRILKNKKVVKSAPKLYTVDLPDEHIAKMLDWDKPLSEEIKPTIRKAFKKRDFSDTQINSMLDNDITGQQAYVYISSMFGEKEASEMLNKLGIPGIKYHDAMSRAAGEGTRNFVLFDPSIATITKRE